MIRADYKKSIFILIVMYILSIFSSVVTQNADTALYVYCIHTTHTHTYLSAFFRRKRRKDVRTSYILDS